ncbi:rhomboid family intramembrane serine protease [Mucilaginibacter mali]|uniref:Rhomboid family intramembrane serine protease n=1 Tax=Mucilaginibacter mali TaxID=2740462 RepID=A0A7D4TQY6_9SPHI|nr:rhomboid family intramembrane serine protease [Mucilaginibacter mali]QKJ31734.1 rhomboid family intramembrane serine protease [Mucilaginibacter mali]
MLQNPFANLTPVVKNLLLLNVVFYIAAYVFGHAGIFDMDGALAAYYPGSPKFRMWQIITYMFMHAPPGNGIGLAHIFFNMFALVSFGPIIEQTIGDKRFFLYYFICGLGALACQIAVQAFEIYSVTGHLFVPGVTLENMATYAPYLGYSEAGIMKLAGVYNVGLVGASGAIFGVLVAFGMLYPDLELMVIPIPVPVKAKYLIPVYIVIELYLGFKQFAGDSVAHTAHLGGALIGFILIKTWGYSRRDRYY